MTRKEKMLQIKEHLEHRANFKKGEHGNAQYGKDSVAYYITDNSYFDIKYKGFSVNVTGDLDTTGLDEIVKFNLDEWLDEILKVVQQKICLIDGKEYLLTEASQVKEEPCKTEK